MVSFCAIWDSTNQVFQSMIWGFLSAAICQAAYDAGSTGTLLWDFFANDVLKRNDTQARADAEAIPGAVIVSRLFWFAITFCLFTTIISVCFAVRKLYQNEPIEKFKRNHLQNSARLTETVSSGGSVKITIDYCESRCRRT